MGFERRNALRPFLDAPPRTLLLPPTLNAMLDGKNDVKTGFPALASDIVVATYLAGWRMRVSRKSAPDVDLEQLEGLDDVWAMCFRKPKPGWRILGRFAECDVFVGIEIYDRHVLGLRANYTAIASNIPGLWETQLSGVTPIRSNDLSSYLTGQYVDVDQET